MEHRTWWIDNLGNLRTPAGQRIARRENGRLLFWDTVTRQEVPMTASDWERIFAMPEEPPAVTISCHCGEALTMRNGCETTCPVCGRAWQMSPLTPWHGTHLQVLPCRS